MTAMNTLDAIIIDDEPLARQNMRILLRAHPRVRVVGEAENARQAREIIAKLRPQVIFLDIQLPGGSGFELLSSLERPPRVIFVTAYDRFALRAFEVNAVDYLLKPVEPERLAESLRRLHIPPVMPTAPFHADDAVLLHTAERMCFLPLGRLSLILADGNYTVVMDSDGACYTIRRTVKEWGALLPPAVFVLLDRSTIMNRCHIREWTITANKARIFLGGSDAPLLLGPAGTRRFRRLLADLR